MGLCASEKHPDEDDVINSTEDDVTSTFQDLEDSMTWQSMTDRDIAAEDEGMKYPGVLGISNLVFASDSALTFTKPLFGGSCATLYKCKSEPTFLERNVTFYVEPLTEVTPQLFFGTFEDANNEVKLKGLGITHIISLIGPKHEIKGMKHEHKPMSDFGRTDLKRVVTTLWPSILESQQVGNKLFIHCQCGQNRSATVVLCILMKLMGEKLDVLYRMVKEKRPVIQINEKYAKQLSEMEIELFGETSVPRRWMSICSYDMVSGDVEFNEELDVAVSPEETRRTLSNESHESKKLDTSSTVNSQLSSLNDYDISGLEDLSPSIKFCTTPYRPYLAVD